jgi:hypothetical protein
MHLPSNVALDVSGNLYIADYVNNRIRMVSPSGIISTVAGNGVQGYSGDNGPATSAGLFYPFDLAVDASGNLYIADNLNNRIRKVSPNGIISTVAGNGTGGFSGENGAATTAELNEPIGVALDASGDLYIVDETNNQIRKVNIGITAALNFANTVVGSQSTNSPQSFGLSNIGNAALIIPPPSAGTNPSVASGFTYDSSSTCPQLSVSSSPYSLASGASCTYALDFIPIAVGPDNGSLVLSDNSLNNSGSTQSVSLNGTGTSVTITLSPSSLSSTAVGTSYSQAISAGGGASPYTYVVSGGTLPTGISFSSAGVLSGTPTAGGTFSFTLQATDNLSFVGSQAYSLNVAAPIITLPPTSLPGALGGSAYSQTITAVGGTASYTYAVTNGSLPIGMTLSPAGLLSGSPMAAGNFSFTVSATDSSTGTGPFTGSQAYSLSVAAPTVNLAPSGSFGSVNVGSVSSSPTTLTFTFYSGVTLGSAAVLTQGAAGLDFTDAGGDTCTAGTAYNAGGTCTVNVNFKPTAPGVRYGAAELLDLSGNVLATGYVQGIGVGPQVNFMPGTQSTLGTGFAYPEGVAVDGSGNVFVVDCCSKVVKEIVAAGGYSTIERLGSGFSDPEGVAVDGAGNIFVADSGNNSVKEIVAAGGYTTVNTLGSGCKYPPA